MRKRIRALLAHRQTVGRVGGFAVTVAFALYNGILGAIYASIWHGSICLYYLLLSALRGILLSAVRRPARERRAFRCTSLLLPVLDLSLTVPAAMMVLDRKPVQIGQIPAIGMAAYTTYKVVLAAIGLKRSKRTESLAEKALRTIAFTDALVSVLTLQNTLIVVMDGGMGGKMQILSACSSAALLALAVFAAVWNIVIGRRSAAQRR